MTEITLILFDLNGVLYRYVRDTRIAHLSRLCQQPPAVVKSAIWDSGFEDQGDAGIFDADTYLAGFAARLGVPLTEAQWVAANQSSLTPIAGNLSLLPLLPATVGCAVLTNNNMLVKRHFAVLYPDIAGLVGDRSLVSAEFGVSKPDPEVYRRCLNRLGTDPAATLFIDDNASNVAGAVAAGLQGHHLGDPDTLIAVLTSLGLIAVPGR